MTPIAGDRIVDMTNPGIIDHIAFTIRLMESGDNYTQLNKTASASGAYQIINGTWINTKGTGWSQLSGVPNATSYPRAYQAPDSIQDAVAKWKIRGILAAYGGHLAAVPVLWYVPAAWGNDTLLDTKPAGNPLTPREYAVAWIKKYDSIHAPDNTKGGEVPGAPQLVPSDESLPGASWIPGLVDPFGIVSGAGKAAASVVDAVDDPLGAAKAALNMAIKVGEFLANPSTWIRLLQVVGGTILVGMGIWIITHNTENMVPDVSKLAASAALA